MSYEEKFIDGKLMFRTFPGFQPEWQEKTSAVAIVANQVIKLNDEERKELFGLFCVHCGSTGSRCYCWDDS